MPANPTARSQPSRAHWWKNRVSSLLVIILTPFIALSESSIKSLIDAWLNQCIVVFEKESIPPNRVKVVGHVSGKTPTSLPITFTAYDVLINRIKFSTDVDQSNVSSFANLALHPLTNAACPGTLCEILGDIPSSPKRTITLKDVSPEFLYQFVVEFDQAGAEDKLSIFIQYDPGLKDGVCRVEYANIFNYLARATKWGKFWFMVLLFLSLAVIIGAIRRFPKEE